MKKVWQKPVLEVLDVKMTMQGTVYTNFDDNFQQHNGIPVDGHGNPLIGES